MELASNIVEAAAAQFAKECSDNAATVKVRLHSGRYNYAVAVVPTKHVHVHACACVACAPVPGVQGREV